MIANHSVVFALIVLVHLKGYMVPAPVDYEWAKHVEPIRQGVPANIPTLPEGWILEYRGRPQPGKLGLKVILFLSF